MRDYNHILPDAPSCSQIFGSKKNKYYAKGHIMGEYYTAENVRSKFPSTPMCKKLTHSSQLKDILYKTITTYFLESNLTIFNYLAFISFAVITN
jgi:hypothetical protein